MEGRDFRLWQFHDMNSKRDTAILRQNYLESLRPQLLLKNAVEDEDNRGVTHTTSVENLENENLLYIELGQPEPSIGYHLAPYNEDSEL